MVYLGVDYPPPLDAHHTFIAPTLSEVNHWWRDRNQQPIPQEHFGMIDWPTFSDPSLAPADNHVLNVMLAGTYHGVDWDRHKNQFINGVIQYLSRARCRALLSTYGLRRARRRLTSNAALALDTEGCTASPRTRRTSRCFVHPTSRKSIKHLYLVGSSTNPGGGVPTVIASGTITANLVERYET
jgi:phytoene desaturase